MRLPSLDRVFQSLVALVVVLAIAVLLRLLWRKLFVRDRGPGRLDRWLAENTGTPVFLAILAVGAQVVIGRLAALPEIRDLPGTPYLIGAAFLFTVCSVTWVAYGVVKGVSEWYLTKFAPASPSTLESELIPAVRLVIKLLLIFTAVIVVLDHYNVKLTAILGAAGLASLVLALAAQDTLANMFAGFSIMVDRPFRIGDRIELTNGRIGDVHEIGLRSTRILSPDNTVFIIPNSELAKSSVINHSYPNDKINVRQQIRLPYGCDPARVKRILVEICRDHPMVLSDPPPQAYLSELGESVLQVNFNFWIADFRTQGRVVDEINTAVYARFEREGIQISVPREVRLVPESKEDLAHRQGSDERI